MEWIKLNKENLPEGEILAANFKVDTYGYKEKIIGYLYVNNDNVECDGGEILENCTHYIDINNFDLK